MVVKMIILVFAVIIGWSLGTLSDSMKTSQNRTQVAQGCLVPDDYFAKCDVNASRYGWPFTTKTVYEYDEKTYLTPVNPSNWYFKEVQDDKRVERENDFALVPGICGSIALCTTQTYAITNNHMVFMAAFLLLASSGIFIYSKLH